MKRILIGRRPDGQVGMFLSRPTEDAERDAVDGFLIRPSVKNAQVLLAGITGYVSGSVYIPYGPFNFTPLVYAKFMEATGESYTNPFFNTGADQGEVTVARSASGMLVTVFSPGYVQYLVFRADIP